MQHWKTQKSRRMPAFFLHLGHVAGKRPLARRYFGANRIAPSSRITSFNMSFSTMCLTSVLSH